MRFMSSAATTEAPDTWPVMEKLSFLEEDKRAKGKVGECQLRWCAFRPVRVRVRGAVQPGTQLSSLGSPKISEASSPMLMSACIANKSKSAQEERGAGKSSVPEAETKNRLHK